MRKNLEALAVLESSRDIDDIHVVISFLHNGSTIYPGDLSAIGEPFKIKNSLFDLYKQMNGLIPICLLGYVPENVNAILILTQRKLIQTSVCR